MSPSAPVPKSNQPRQSCGWYSFEYGRAGAAPSQRSQSIVLGTGGVSVGRSRSCFHHLPGRSVHEWISRTGPIAPACSHSRVRRSPSPAWPLLPICVTRPVSRATRVMTRASSIECAIGFST